jgi:hypothetical protein
MIECYYKWCKWHPVMEPFCSLKDCLASKQELVKFNQLRREELDAVQRHFRERNEFLRGASEVDEPSSEEVGGRAPKAG